MPKSFERMMPNNHAHELDELMDVLGFGGEPREVELVDYLQAAEKAIPSNVESEEYKQYLMHALSSEYRELEATGLSSGAIASYLLGSATWRIVTYEANKTAFGRHETLIDRSLQNIRLTRERFAYGDESKFYAGFATYTKEFGETYDAPHRRYIYKLCRYAEQGVAGERRAQHGSHETKTVARQAWLSYVVKGLATIAMMQGYQIQPPEEQTDKDGAWQLPEEYPEHEENGDI